MSSHRAELEALATRLTEMTERMGALGQELDKPDTEAAAASLYEVERALRTGRRSLVRAIDRLS